jgi:hypothetical protein
MLRVNINESFPITVTLIDEKEGILSTGNIVQYEIRKQPDDLPLNPPLLGILSESTVEPGVYKTTSIIEEPGIYLVYATCSGFISNTEEIIVNDENIFDIIEDDLKPLIKQNRHFNISVEDVIRVGDTPSNSQLIRNVPKGRTDYVITKIKGDNDLDWSGSNVIEGRVYAWYRTNKDKAPYKMGGSE